MTATRPNLPVLATFDYYNHLRRAMAAMTVLDVQQPDEVVSNAQRHFEALTAARTAVGDLKNDLMHWREERDLPTQPKYSPNGNNVAVPRIDGTPYEYGNILLAMGIAYHLAQTHGKNRTYPKDMHPGTDGNYLWMLDVLLSAWYELDFAIDQYDLTPN